MTDPTYCLGLIQEDGREVSYAGYTRLTGIVPRRIRLDSHKGYVLTDPLLELTFDVLFPKGAGGPDEIAKFIRLECEGTRNTLFIELVPRVPVGKGITPQLKTLLLQESALNVLHGGPR